MAVAQLSVFVSIGFFILYSLVVFLISRGKIYSKFISWLFSSVLLIFLIYYHINYYGKLTNETINIIIPYVRIIAIVLYLPFVIAAISMTKKIMNNQEKKFLTWLVFGAVLLLFLLIWLFIFDSIFLGFV